MCDTYSDTSTSTAGHFRSASGSRASSSLIISANCPRQYTLGHYQGRVANPAKISAPTSNSFRAILLSKTARPRAFSNASCSCCSAFTLARVSSSSFSCKPRMVDSIFSKRARNCLSAHLSASHGMTSYRYSFSELIPIRGRN